MLSSPVKDLLMQFEPCSFVTCNTSKFLKKKYSNVEFKYILKILTLL